LRYFGRRSRFFLLIKPYPDNHLFSPDPAIGDILLHVARNVMDETMMYYGVSNKRPGLFIKSEKDFHPGRFLFQAARMMIVVPWHQNNNDRSGILKRFIDQENLQMYAQMDGILFSH